MKIKDEWNKFPGLFKKENEELKLFFIDILKIFYNNGLNDEISGGVLESLYYQEKLEKKLKLPFNQFLDNCYKLEILLPKRDDYLLNENYWYINPKITRSIKINDILKDE